MGHGKEVLRGPEGKNKQTVCKVSPAHCAKMPRAPVVDPRAAPVSMVMGAAPPPSPSPLRGAEVVPRSREGAQPGHKPHAATLKGGTCGAGSPGGPGCETARRQEGVCWGGAGPPHLPRPQSPARRGPLIHPDLRARQGVAKPAGHRSSTTPSACCLAAPPPASSPPLLHVSRLLPGPFWAPPSVPPPLCLCASLSAPRPPPPRVWLWAAGPGGEGDWMASGRNFQG